jgi:hypothetical protein
MTAPQERPTSAARPAFSGHPRVITAITPIRPFGTLWLRLTFGISRKIPSTMGIRELSSLYFTRWSIVTRLPYNGPPQVRERLPHPILFWETNYNGAMESYIEAFVHLIGRQIRWTWGPSYGFPGTASVTKLREYIESVAFPVAHLYSPYPEASVRMILSALAVEREDRFLQDAAQSTSPEEFAVVYRGFLARRQGDL